MGKVTLADIGRHLGISKMAVSYALRNDSAVAAETRRKVKDLAKALGYRRNPLFSMHMAKLRMDGATRFRPKLAFLNPQLRREDFFQSPARSDFLRGAVGRARELGYEVEEVWLHDPALAKCSLKTLFRKHGIHGFISLGEPEDKDIPWNGFPSVIVGYTQTRLGLHRVCNNQRHSAQMVIERLCARGLRVGMAMRRQQDLDLDENYSAPFLSRNAWLPPARRLPVYRPDVLEKDAFLAWLATARPDAVAGLSYSTLIPWIAEYNQMHGTGIIPVAFAHSQPWRGCPGVNQHSRKVGATALDIVVQQITLGLSGIPKEPWLILLEGEWVDGNLPS